MQPYYIALNGNRNLTMVCFYNMVRSTQSVSVGEKRKLHGMCRTSPQ